MADTTRTDVLVVGDWMIDIDWVVGPHRSESSRLTGHDHSIALHGPTSTTRALGGAGHVMSILRTEEPESRDRHYGRVFGLGAWHEKDDALIQGMTRVGANCGDNLLSLSLAVQPDPDHPSDPSVFRLFEHGGATNQLVRIYRKASNGNYVLERRIDFEQALPKGRSLPRELQKKLANVGYVLVKDHGRGLVNSDLITLLIKSFGKKPPIWFLCSKEWEPEWFKNLHDQDIRLVVVPPEAAATATIRDPFDSNVGNWLVSGRVPSRRAMQAMDDIADVLQPLHRNLLNIVVLPSRTTTLVKVGNTQDDRRSIGLLLDTGRAIGMDARFPSSGVLFAALFHFWHRLQFDAVTPISEWQRWISSSVNFAIAVSRDCLDRITYPDNWVSKRVPLVDHEAIQREVTPFDWDYVSYSHTASFVPWPTIRGDKAWAARYSLGKKELESISEQSVGFGVIRDADGNPRIDLWRAMTEVAGCISIPRAKRAMLSEIALEIDTFRKATPRRHKSFLIVDEPGGGKTTMVRRLAEANNLRFLSFNVTELMQKGDLLACFDTIVTSQAQDPSRPILVFFDEINAKLDHDAVYSAFLTPLEDGHYRRDGKAFLIEPCVWIFASTENPLVDPTLVGGSGNHSTTQAADGITEPLDRIDPNAPGLSAYRALRRIVENDARKSKRTSSLNNKSDKASDFVSRLSRPPFILDRVMSAVPNDPAKLKASFEGIDILSQEELLWTALGREQHKSLRGAIVAWLIQEGRTMERVYVGASIIKSVFPDVDYVSMRVLAAIACLDDDVTLRDIRHEIEECVQVQYGKLTWRNMSRRFQKRSGRKWIYGDDGWKVNCTMSLEDLTSDIDDELVRIVPVLTPNDISWTGLTIAAES